MAARRVKEQHPGRNREGQFNRALIDTIVEHVAAADVSFSIPGLSLP
jgi:hypothetical protein